MEDDELQELSAEEILLFGPCVEAVTWTPIFLQESRAPIAVAAGRPKLGPVFNSEGVGKAVLIRPCISRGRKVRGLSPIYTPGMLEANANVFDGWPMFMDHQPPELAAALAKHGRSVKELGGQVLKGAWARDFVQESDREFGYQKGGVLAEVWVTPFIRKTVGENADLLHTSINAWPKSGKPGDVPWRPGMKGMVIEGIRRQPQGSVDFVVRGGAGGRLLVAEGAEDEGVWPEVGEWSEDDKQLVVSVAESLYASAQMKPLPTKPDELKAYLQEEAPHLLTALAEDGAGSGSGAPAPTGGESKPLTEEDIRRIVQEASQGQPTVEEFEQSLREQAEEMLAERETARAFASIAHEMIREADGIPPAWAADLRQRYAVLPSGPQPTLLVEAATDEKGNEKSAEQVLRENVTADLDHVRELVAEARGKPRVTGEGGAKPDAAGGERNGKAQESVPYWRDSFARMGLAEDAEHAIEVFGGKVEG